jgi:anti-sigma-K factor RskA
MRDHDRIEGLLAARALGGIDPEDEAALERELAAHGPDCAECRRLEAELGEVAGRLAFALDPAPVREELEDEIVRRAAPDRPHEPAEPAQPSRAGRWVRPLAAVAAAIVLFVTGVGIGVWSSREPSVPPDARVVTFEGEDAGGTLAIAYRPGADGVYVLGSGLQAPPDGDVYALWMFQDGTPVLGGCFVPTPDGSVFEFVDAGLASTQQMAVTVEPSTCPSAPTSAPILTAEITA